MEYKNLERQKQLSRLYSATHTHNERENNDLENTKMKINESRKKNSMILMETESVITMNMRVKKKPKVTETNEHATKQAFKKRRLIGYTGIHL